MQTQLSLDERRAVAITPKRGAKVPFVREGEVRLSRRMRAMAIGALATAALAAAKPALAQTTPLFTTQDDWSATNGWSGQNGGSVATSTLFDADQSTTNGAGNIAAPGGTATVGAGSIAITLGLGGFNDTAEISAEQNNAAFLAAFDPGATAGSGTATATSTAYNGVVQLAYTQPALPAGGYFQIGIFLQYGGDGYYGPMLATSTTPISTGVNNTGETEMLATIPYSMVAGAFNGFGFGIFVNTNAPTGETFYVDNLATVVTTPPPTFSDETSKWIKNGGSSAWETAANWSSSPDAGTIPGAAGSMITFDNNGGAITANPTVTLSNAVSARLITFGNISGVGTAVNYTISPAAGNAGLLAAISVNDTVDAEIDADSGTHVINVPVNTSTGNFFFGMAPGASLSIPSYTNSSNGTITVTSPLAGGSAGGTLTLGTSAAHWSVINDAGVVTFLPGSGGFLYGITAATGATVNLGANTWNSNSISGDSGGGGIINVPTGGTLYTAEYVANNGIPGTVFYSGTLGGGGSIVVGEGQTSTDTGQIIYGNSLALFGNDSGFSGTFTAGSSLPPGSTFTTTRVPFTLEVQAANSLGDGSATNKIILDGGIFQSIGSFVATQNVTVTANGGTIDTDGPAGGNTNNGPIAGGTAITLGAISSTAAGAQLTKIISGQLTVTSIRGVGLTIGNVQSGAPTSGGTIIIGPNNGTLAGAQAGVSVLTSLTIQTDTSGNYLSTLDLKNNSMIVQGAGSAGAATIAAEIAVGRNNNPVGGLWTGTGITSSSAAAAPVNTALGMELNDNGSGSPLVTTFEGQTVADGDVLVKYTFAGDADLSGHINASDYTLIDNGFNSQSTAHPLTGWRNGDFNYDGVVNGDDYTLIDNSYNTQGSVTFLGTSTQPANQIASNTEQVSAVPEPGTLSLIALTGLLMSRRRSRR